MNCLTLPETGTLYSPGNPRKYQIGPPGTKTLFQKNMIQEIPAPKQYCYRPFHVQAFSRQKLNEPRVSQNTNVSVWLTLHSNNIAHWHFKILALSSEP